MTLDQIEVFKIISEKGSFRAAAESLNRAQSAVSHAIKKLEAELGFQLFDRGQYRPKLTPEGEAFYKKAQTLFQNFRELESFAQNLKRGCEPQIRLAVSALFPLKPILKSLEQLRWRFPTTEVKLVIDILGADRLLLQDKADLALTEMRGSPQQLESLEIGGLQMWAVTGKKSRLLKSPAQQWASELQQHPQIVLRSSDVASDRASGVLNEANVWTVTDFTSKKELLLSGLGWGYMPEHLVDEELQRGLLVKILKDPHQVPAFLSRAKTKNQGPSSQFLWEDFKSLKF